MAKKFSFDQFVVSQKVVERACKVDMKMRDELVVKELVESCDLDNFLNGVNKSEIRKGNNLVIEWLSKSSNILKKLRFIFHGHKFKLG